MTPRRLAVVVALVVVGFGPHTLAVALYEDACESRRGPAACEGMTDKYGRTDLALGPVDMAALAVSARRPGLAEPAPAIASGVSWALGWTLWGWPLWLLLTSLRDVDRSARRGSGRDDPRQH